MRPTQGGRRGPTLWRLPVGRLQCQRLKASYGPQGGTVQFCSAHAAGRHVNQHGLAPRKKANVGDSAHIARLAEVAAWEAKREAREVKRNAKIRKV